MVEIHPESSIAPSRGSIGLLSSSLVSRTRSPPFDRPLLSISPLLARRICERGEPVMRAREAEDTGPHDRTKSGRSWSADALKTEGS
jgi:hypothetical protein